MRLLIVSLVLCLLVILPYCDASCMMKGELNMQVTMPFKIRRYCLEKFNDGSTKEWEFHQQTVENCERCTCDGGGLHCCGIGYRAAVFHPPEGCTMQKLDNCCYRFVQIQNNQVTCGDRDRICPEN